MGKQIHPEVKALIHYLCGMKYNRISAQSRIRNHIDFDDYIAIYKIAHPVQKVEKVNKRQAGIDERKAKREQRNADIIALNDRGVTAEKIAEMYNMTPENVRYIVRNRPRN